MRSITKGVIIAGALAVFAAVALKGAAILIPSGTWVPQTNLSSARANASAALLQDGRVLITGGDSGSGPVATADFFAADGTISAAPPMVNARSTHVAVTLQDGRVLVAGGVSAGGSATSTAEIYDPAANSWTSVGTGMTEARSNASAALLPDGRVIIAGGQNGSTISATIEIFDPVAGSFSFAGTMSSSRTQHAMAVLHDGRVIITGGSNGTSPVASTDILDPVAGTISAGPSLAVARFGHSATTLQNGQVVVIGGNNGNADPAQMDLASAELFDPAAGTFTTLAANMATPREGHLAILLPNNNNVLIVGGMSGGAAIAAAELFIPQESSQGAWTYGFSFTGSMSTARSNAAGSANQVTAPSSVMQRNGVLMVAGGNDASGNALNSSEGYGYATIQTDQGDYPPGTTVTITGSGWKPGETVNLQLVESPLIDTHGPYTVQADASGNISDSSFVTDANDALIRFTLTAAGLTSGFQAQTTFTDAPAPTVACTPNPVNVGSASTCTATVNNSQGDIINWTHTGSGSFDATSCTIGGSPNFSCSVQYTPSAAGSSLVTATDGAKSGTFTVTTPANLSATKSNNVSGSITLPTNSWTWKIALANTGFTDATFANGNKVLHDDLPSGLTYGSVSGAPAHLTCSIVSNVLTCNVSSSTVTIAAGGGFTVSFTSTDSANTVASFANPASGGSCAVDPNNVITEATGSNTACSDTVAVNSATVSTTTAVSSSANPSAFGQSVNFTATVTATSGTPTGKVQFKVDGSNFGGQITLVGGMATSGSTSSLSVGNHTVEADYLGDSGFNTSTGTLSGGQAVNKADTSSAVSSSANPSVFGQSVMFTALVSAVAPGSGTPAGTVQFVVDGSNFGSPVALAGGTGTSGATATLAVTGSPHTVTANYVNSDGNFKSTSGTLTGGQTVNPAPTSTSVSSSANPSTFGQSVTFTATVMNTAGAGISTATPTGAVQFVVDGSSFGSPVALSGSGATATATSQATATLTVNGDTPHTVTANYVNSDGNFKSTSGALTSGQTVNPAPTSTSVSSSANPSVFGQSVTFTATVMNTAGAGISTATPTGAVQFVVDGSSFGSPVALLGSGATATATSQATATLTVNGGTAHTVTANYVNSDGNFKSTSGTLTGGQTVNPAPTSTSVSSSANPSVFGQSVTFTATVMNTAGAGISIATPTGAVQFVIDGSSFGSPVALLGSGATATATSQATATLTVNGGTAHTVTANYVNSDGNFKSTSGTLTGGQTVNPAPTSTSVSSSANPSVFGQSVTFTATVMNTAGAGISIATPTGAVQFVVDGTDFGSPVAVSGSGATATATSQATATLTVNGGTPHTVTANYVNSDGNFKSTSGTLTGGQTVNPAPTSTSVSSSANPSVFGQSVTFTATVMNTAGAGISIATPTDAVQFVIDGSSFGSPVALLGSGATATATSQATATLTVNGGTAHTVTANYVNSDGNFKSTSGTLTGGQTVNPAPTSTSVSSSANPSVFGQSVTFTATVMNTAGAGISTATPTGAVQFVVDGSSFGSPVALSGSGATATATSQATATLTVNGGTAHTVTANYVNSDGNFKSTSGTLTGGQTVNPAPTSTSVSSSANPSVFGQSVTFTATVMNTAGAGISTATPTGAVQFVVDGTDFGSPVALSGSGATATATSQATATLTVNGGTAHTVTANYVNSDGNFKSTSGTLTGGQTVNPAPTSTSVSSSANPSVFGQSVTFTATVMNTAGAGISTATPTGAVQFVVDGSSFGSPVALSGSGATATATSQATATLTVNGGTPHTVTANYVNSDGNFGNSSGSLTGGQAVNPAPTSTSVSSSANPSVFGQSVTFTATVMNTAGAGISIATPTDAVQFVIDGSSFGSPVALLGSGATATATSQATATLTVNGGTAHTVTANYVNSDGNFGNSSGSLTGGQTVNPAPTSTSVSSSANPSTFGQSVTFTATVINTAGAGISTATPTGSVQFVVDGSNFGSPVALVAGSATSGAISTLAVSGSPHTVTANYINADGNFSNSSGSLTGGQTVNPAPTSTSVSSSANPSTFGQSVTFTATVMNTAGAGISTATPTGSVQFVVDGSNFGSPVALVAGSATSGAISTLTVSGSPHTVTANYINADGNFSNSSGSLTGGQTVKPAPTSTSVSSSANPSTFGQSVTFAATVSNTQTSPTPTGSVQFVVDGSNFGSPVALVAGSATSGAISTLTVSGSPHTVTANYVNSDGNFSNSSGSLTGGQTVKPAPTSTSVNSSANPSTDGQSVTFTATVMNTAGAGVSTATPTGSVQFVVDGSNFGSPVPVAGSGATATAASMSTTTLSVGPHSVVATYTNSDGNFAGGTSPTLTQQVNYGFLGLQSPYMPPPTTFNVKRTMPLKWQYTNSGGAVVNSASANPVVMIKGPYTCGGTDSANGITVNDAGASGYQYDPTTNTWQFNWQIKGNAPGCYNIYIESQQSGQTNGPFPISVVNQ